MITLTNFNPGGHWVDMHSHNHVDMTSFTPTLELAEWVEHELNSRTAIRPILSLHKYFARRSGRVFNWAISEVEKIFPDESNLRILDPMAGGGTIPWESAMRGHDVYAADLNPIASLIQKGMFDPPEPENFSLEVKKFLDDAEKNLAHLFETEVDGEKYPILYRHYVREVDCSECPERFKLYSHTMFNRGRKRGKAQSKKNQGDSWCPHCGENNLTPETNVCCKSCGLDYNAESGTIEVKKKKKSTTCPNCGGKSTPGKLLDRSTKLRLVGVEYRNGMDKILKKPTTKDLEDFDKVIKPQELGAIPLGNERNRLRNSGFATWESLFTPNQLLAYDYLFRRTFDIKDAAAKHWIRLGLSSTLEYQCALVSFNFKYRKSHHLFTHHAYPVPETGVEGNVVGYKRDGAGTVRNSLNSLVKLSRKIHHSDNWMKTEDVEWGSVELINGDSRNLPPNVTGIKAVVTDPPYHDSIEYEELTDFFKAWWRFYFAEDYPEVCWEEISSSQATPSKDDPQKFTRILGEIFGEAYSRTDEDGVLVFTFHDTNEDGWMELAESIDKSNWKIFDFVSIQSEYKGNIHLQDYSDPMDEDIIFICKKQTSKHPPKRESDGIYSHAWKVWEELYS